MFSEMFKFFIENELMSSNQFDFKRGDSCVNQLVSITHEIYKSFDEGQVWHDGIISKLTQNRIPGNLLKLSAFFLSERRQRIVLNGQASTWTNVTTGVHQGSIFVFNLYKWSLGRTFYEC